MATPCPICQPVFCDVGADDSLYNFQQMAFPWILNCPPGYDCHNSTGFHMVCCGTPLSVDFPPGTTDSQKQNLINQIVSQCNDLLAICGQQQGCKNPPCDPPPPTTQLFYNREVSCSSLCPDGSAFSFTVAAGTFAALTQTDADKQAQDYACQQSVLLRVCFNPFTACCCVDAAFSRNITATGGIAPVMFSVVSGTLPPGITVTSGGLVSGTPNVPGSFTFGVRATSAAGGTVTKNITITVLQILTTSITGYTVGTPYSFQMTAAGGSGNYQWSIASGSLPDGLTMSNSGLITGTPTGGAGVSPILFRMVDLSCEAAQQSVFPARITMATQSTTQIATVRGYDEFIPSTPPKRYHTASWSGTSEQKLFVNGVQIGGAKYEYSGFDHVDSQGLIDSTHSKIFSAQCNNPSNFQYGQIQGSDTFGGPFNARFKGYYGMAVQVPSLIGNPTFLCPSSSIPYDVVGDIAINGTFDRSDFWGSAKVAGTLNIGLSDYAVVDATTRSSTDVGTTDVLVTPYCPTLGVAYSLVLTPSDYFTSGLVDYNNDYSCVLSDEYTDAEALSNALVISGNSSIAQNSPRTTGFVSTFTTVVFTLLATNLIENQNYLVSVDFWDQNTAVVTTRQYGFTADNTGKHSITDVVPTPIVGHTLQARNPRIAFVT